MSLEYRFNDSGEVTGVFSPGRFGRFDGGFRRLPWEGRFRDYRECAGMWIPYYGEVGWHIDGELRLVWQGTLGEARYELAAA